MPFQPGVPDEINTRNDEDDGQGITISSSGDASNSIYFYNGMEEAQQYGPSEITTTWNSNQFGTSILEMKGPDHLATSGDGRAAVRLLAAMRNLTTPWTLAAISADTVTLRPDSPTISALVQVGYDRPTGDNFSELSYQSPAFPTTKSAVRADVNRVRLRATAIAQPGATVDIEATGVKSAGPLFQSRDSGDPMVEHGAHHRWNAIAAGSQNPFWNGNTRHGLAFPFWQAQCYWDGGPLAHLQVFYDTGAVGFAAGVLGFTPQDINFQIQGGTATRKLTMPFSPTVIGRPLSAGCIVGNGAGNWRTRTGVRQVCNAAIANGVECLIFDADDAAGPVTMPSAPFSFPRLWMSFSAILPVV